MATRLAGPIGKGALLALAIAAPTIVLAEVLDATTDIDPDSNIVLVFYFVVLAGLVLGGRLAASLSSDALVVHAALAALAAYAALAAVTTAVQVGDGDSVDVVAIVFNALMAATAGTLGGLLASRRPAGRTSR